ncbi:unnamed protein product [Ranitomeya imitator]|uniref:Ku domain-containing protein n=1 Tax=Ranitomeya imitator TaxID=111125 RepID=A0ABN9KQ16_9NEOB|nr:unnamed protein product [Ranitomeya imitator]
MEEGDLWAFTAEYLMAPTLGQDFYNVTLTFHPVFFTDGDCSVYGCRTRHESLQSGGRDAIRTGEESHDAICAETASPSHSGGMCGSHSALSQGVVQRRGLAVALQLPPPLTPLPMVFAESKDEVAVVLFGTDGTDNALAAPDQYQNITVQRHLMLPDFQLLEEIQDVIEPGAQQADCILRTARLPPPPSTAPSLKGTVTLSDAAAIPTTIRIAAASLFGRWRAVTQTALQRPTIPRSPVTRVNIGQSREAERRGQTAVVLDALIVSMDILQKETLGKKYEKLHIAVLTDLSSPFTEDQLEIIIANMKKAGITLQFFLPFHVDEDGAGDGGDDGRRSGPGKGLSAQQKDGIQMVRQIMFSLEGEDGLGEVYTFRDSLENLSMFKKIARRPMAWPCVLTIGSNISIRIVGYKLVTEEKVKKSWMNVDAKSLRKDDIQKETVFCLNNDEESEIDKEDTIQGFRYGSDIIPFSKMDQDQMKYKTESKCFSVLGFAKASQIERTHFLGNQVLRVFAPSDDEAATIALSALIRALHDMEMVAVVRYAYDRRCNPQVGVAFPLIKEKYEVITMQQGDKK